jgi:hypothetical protein
MTFKTARILLVIHSCNYPQICCLQNIMGTRRVFGRTFGEWPELAPNGTQPVVRSCTMPRNTELWRKMKNSNQSMHKVRLRRIAELILEQKFMI